MVDLSPAAQSVLKAAEGSYWCFDAMAPANAEVIAAATIRAVADAVAPIAMPHRRKVREELYGIANQLENIND
jgi:hypothetical protein